MSAIAFDYPTRAAHRPERRAVVQTIADAIRRRIAIHRNRRILHSLSDSTLRDMGIERDRINDIVAERLDHRGKPQGPYPF